jgi:hypothetical protein
MKIIYHRQITQQALGNRVSPQALGAILAANVGQDALRYQVGHDHFHYDSNAFTRGDAYVESQQGLIRQALSRGEPQTAWQAFGRLSHAVQDLYAHSNYIALWLAKNHGANLTPGQMDPLDVDILSSPDLRSGKPHVFDLLFYFNLLPSSWLKHVPKDSHLLMNIDGPDRPNFDFVFSAAVMRTRVEFARVLSSLTSEMTRAFTDL